MENWELQKQELRRQLIGEERFFQAKNDLKIFESEEEKISEALRYAMVKIGLRANNFPSQTEKFLLIQHIIENFGSLTVSEIRLAFDWAIDDRLDLGPDGFNCYENFSCAYVTKILKAYVRLSGLVKEPEKPMLQIEYKESSNTNELYEEFLKSPFAQRLRKAGINI